MASSAQIRAVEELYREIILGTRSLQGAVERMREIAAMGVEEETGRPPLPPPSAPGPAGA